MQTTLDIRVKATARTWAPICFLLRINRLRVLSGGIGKRSLLSEESPELLALSLKEKKRLKSGTNTSFYRRRHAYFVPFFHEEGNLVLSHVSGLYELCWVSKIIILIIGNCSLTAQNGVSNAIYWITSIDSISLAHKTVVKDVYDTIQLV